VGNGLLRRRWSRARRSVEIELRTLPGIVLILLRCLRMVREHRAPAFCAVAATALLCATLAVLFSWIFPANRSTCDWAIATEDWQMLRAKGDILMPRTRR
jgi:hypothetical protein